MNVDRRTLFGAAGATVALAACTPKEPDEVTVLENDRSKGLYGKDLSNKVPGVADPATGKLRPAVYQGEFKPKDDYLAYMKFENGRLKVRTAFFENAGAEDPEAIAERFLSVAKTDRWGAGALAESTSFADFGFGGQARLYFYLDNGNDVRFDDVNRIHMTLYKSKDQQKKLPKDNAFMNPEIRNVGGLSVLYVENWYVSANGKPIKEAYGGQLPDPVEFSMNVHLLMNSGTDAEPFVAPIVLDPDGMNGTNRPPR
jgi:hypothetical protein